MLENKFIKQEILRERRRHITPATIHATNRKCSETS